MPFGATKWLVVLGVLTLVGWAYGADAAGCSDCAERKQRLTEWWHGGGVD